MDSTVKIICENTDDSLYVKMGTPLSEVADILNLSTARPLMAAYVNNDLKELSFKVFEPMNIRFIDATHFAGMKVYERTLLFILQKAVFDLHPHKQLVVKYSVSKGTYCEIEGIEELEQEQIEQIEQRMHEIVDSDIPIMYEKVLSADAEKMYTHLGMYDKISLLRTRPHLYVDIYSLANIYGHFYGVLAPSTGSINFFKLTKYYNGIHVSRPRVSKPEQLNKIIPQNKMFDIFKEFRHWVNVLGVSTIGDLNQKIIEGDASEFIKIAESLHEKKLGSIADLIAERNVNQGTRMVVISGPSSSGKTTFAKRLGVQLRVLGLTPVLISVDDYFVNREDTPKDEKGNYDFEALEAVDVKSFTRDMEALMRGEEVDIPRYDFISGRRVYEDKLLKLDDRSVLVIEGIHGLNPKLTAGIEDNIKFKIYLTALTSISMDNMTRVPTTDNRLIRRIVRDYRTRGNNAMGTLKMWDSVRRGEDKHIFPFQEEADVMFNSSLYYELAVLKPYVEPLLHEIPDTVPEYAEAQRILRFMDAFVAIKNADHVPSNSILKEFIGCSSFTY
ncbi:MAG: nucleoside kinase [Rikenellaceae bacterium]